MQKEAQYTLSGVGALLVCGDEFAAVTETRTSRKSVKIAGQETFPMETVEDVDLGDMATLVRACSEEVAFDLRLAGRVALLSVVETRPGVQLRTYLIPVTSKDLVSGGSFVDEVSSVKWVPLKDVESARGSFRFRPGVYETVGDFNRYRDDVANYEPGRHQHTQLADQIPQGMYDLVESGLSRTAAVSQWLAREQLLVSPGF